VRIHRVILREAISKIGRLPPKIFPTPVIPAFKLPSIFLSAPKIITVRSIPPAAATGAILFT
jgi:hypothetical protein